MLFFKCAAKILKKQLQKVFLQKKKAELLILDDVFPYKLSLFRYTEYLAYLKHFSSIKICVTDADLVFFKRTETKQDILHEFLQEYPEFSEKVTIRSNKKEKSQARLIYVTFLNNAVSHKIAALKIPYIVNLYPGGGLYLNQSNVDLLLEEICSSKYCRKVIVTQDNVRSYLLEKKFCREDQIEVIFGVVTPEFFLNKAVQQKRRYGFEKQNLDICFVAHKYTEFGEDKGYDLFIKVAHMLVQVYKNIRFHVVGSFDEGVIDISSIREFITFYGCQQQSWFDLFYQDKDIILSPNIPFKIEPGSFDGFPTASVTDAALNEVAMFVTDELNLNQNKFIDGSELVLVKPDSDDIVNKIEFYLTHYEQLNEIARKGCLKIKDLYSYDKQVGRRIKIIEEELIQLVNMEKQMQ